ncbi:hypothetical protein 15570_00036 [Lokiarchaeota virus WyrdV1]|nr:hypothetical protein 15570_00036 [Lokiarchaeota virus WyrdV1]
MIQIIDKREGKYSIKNVDSSFMIKYNGEIYALKDLEVIGLKISAVVLKDNETDLIYKRVIKPEID